MWSPDRRTLRVRPIAVACRGQDPGSKRSERGGPALRTLLARFRPLRRPRRRPALPLKRSWWGENGLRVGHPVGVLKPDGKGRLDDKSAGREAAPGAARTNACRRSPPCCRRRAMPSLARWRRSASLVGTTVGPVSRMDRHDGLRAPRRSIGRRAVMKFGASVGGTRVVLAEPDPAEGTQTLHTNSQGEHGTRAVMADDILGIPRGKLRLVCGDVGGGFGMKGPLCRAGARAGRREGVGPARRLGLRAKRGAGERPPRARSRERGEPRARRGGAVPGAERGHPAERPGRSFPRSDPSS
jgi:hypothetical protein